MLKNKLQLQQLEAKIKLMAVDKNAMIPAAGWVNSIRTALNMSLRQLGARLSITPQSAKELEIREKEGSITLKSLAEAANALDMKLVYGFIPKDGSLEALIERKATELARQIVLRTSASMKLEDQQNSEERLNKAIEERAYEIKKELPRLLWD